MKIGPNTNQLFTRHNPQKIKLTPPICLVSSLNLNFMSKRTCRSNIWSHISPQVLSSQNHSHQSKIPIIHLLIFQLIYLTILNQSSKFEFSYFPTFYFTNLMVPMKYITHIHSTTQYIYLSLIHHSIIIRIQSKIHRNKSNQMSISNSSPNPNLTTSKYHQLNPSSKPQNSQFDNHSILKQHSITKLNTKTIKLDLTVQVFTLLNLLNNPNGRERQRAVGSGTRPPMTRRRRMAGELRLRLWAGAGAGQRRRAGHAKGKKRGLRGFVQFCCFMLSPMLTAAPVSSLPFFNQIFLSQSHFG